MTRTDQLTLSFANWLTMRIDAMGRGGMSELAAQLHRSLQAVSEYKSGKKTPRARELGQIAAFFGADPIELADMTGRDALEVKEAFDEYAWPLSIRSEKFITEAFKQLKLSSRLCKCGQAELALENLDRWIGYITQCLNSENAHVRRNDARIRGLNFLLLQALISRMYCINELVPKREIPDHTLSDYRKALRLAKEIKDEYLETMLYAARAANYVVAGQPENAHFFTEKLSDAFYTGALDHPTGLWVPKGVRTFVRGRRKGGNRS